jgi:predicted PurR-regulated permease PerM
MDQMDSRARSAIVVLVVFVAFAWIGCAYIMGAEAKRMILHPVVPILLILLLLGFRGDGSARQVITIAIALIGIWLLARLQGVFMPFIIGFALAYIVNAVLSFLQDIPIPLRKGKKLRLSKGAAAAILVVLLMGFIVFFALGLIPQIVEQAAGMREGIGKFYNSVEGYIVKAIDDWEQKGEYPLKGKLPESWRTTIENNVGKLSVYAQEKVPAIGARASEILTGFLARLSSGIIGTMSQISSVFFILIVFIYAVHSFQTHMDKVKNLIPESQREQIIRYVVEIDTNMRAFLKGQITVIVIISILSAIAYSIIRVPFALFVGLLAGLCNAIPTVGPIIGGGIAVLASAVGFVGGAYSLTGFLVQLALVIGVVMGIQFLDNSLISPKIMSYAIEVHPLVVLFAVLLAASLIGVWGAVLAIPGIVVFKAILKVSNQIRAERGAGEMGLETGE